MKKKLWTILCCALILCFGLTFAFAGCADNTMDSSGKDSGSSTDSPINSGSSEGDGSDTEQGGDVIEDLDIVSLPKTEYNEGDMVDLSTLSFDVVYENGYDGDQGLTSFALDSYKPTGALTAADNAITINYKGFQKSIPITVQAREIESIAVTRMPDISSYSVGSVINLDGMIVTATYKGGNTEMVSGYKIVDASGKEYISGETTLEGLSGEVELTVVYNFNGEDKKTTFSITVFQGIEVQAEDTTVKENASYTVLENGEVKTDCTWTGTGYISAKAPVSNDDGTVTPGTSITFYIYSDVAIQDAHIYLIAASTLWYGDEKTMYDMPLPEIMKAYQVIDGVDQEIDLNDYVLEGKPFPDGSPGNKWTNWADVPLGTMDIQEGFNVIRIEITGSMRGPDNADRTPNIDRLDVRA